MQLLGCNTEHIRNSLFSGQSSRSSVQISKCAVQVDQGSGPYERESYLIVSFYQLCEEQDLLKTEDLGMTDAHFSVSYLAMGLETWDIQMHC